jgi:hypothetical protein
LSLENSGPAGGRQGQPGLAAGRRQGDEWHRTANGIMMANPRRNDD